MSPRLFISAFERFKPENESVEDEQWLKSPSTQKVQKWTKMIHLNMRLTIQDLAERLNISFESMLSILIDDLQMCTKCVPRHL